MKLRVGIKCSGWERPEYVEIELPDETTDDEAEAEMREAAIDASGFEFWLDMRLDAPNVAGNRRACGASG